jgi:putative heme transporter
VRGIPRRAWAARARAMRERLDALREHPYDPTVDAGVEAEEEALALEAADTHPVPATLRAIAEWSWRLIIIGLAVYLTVTYLWRLRVVVFPVLVALMLAAVMRPTVLRLRHVGFGRALSAATVLVAFVLLVVGGLSAAGGQLGAGLSDVANQAEQGFNQIRSWLADGPLNISERQIDRWVEQAQETISNNTDRLTSGAVGAAAAAVEVIAGLFLMLFTLYFFLYDGERIWAWIVRLFPKQTERRMRQAGRLAWRTLQGYVRGTLLVALVDFVLITALLLILRVPLAIPLGVIVFFGAFVPVVGAFVSGTLGVLVALVTRGPVIALIVLAGIIAIQQLEGHVLQPVVMGRLVQIHPLAVVLAIALGSLVAGILGAVIAVPVAAVVNVVVSYLVRGDQPGTPVVRAGPGS